MRIDQAYCVETGTVVDIQSACQAFQERADKGIRRFRFLCSDAECRNSRPGGVIVTAVNHHMNPKDDVGFVSPHFRKVSDHIPSCIWSQLEDEMESAAATEPAKRRLLGLQKRLMTRLVTRFVLSDDAERHGHASVTETELGEIQAITDQDARRRRLRAYIDGAGATTRSLEALVSCYEELRRAESLDVELDVHGYGRTTYGRAFRHLAAPLQPGEHFTVTYGGARYAKDYGKFGFSLEFFDRVLLPDSTSNHGERVTLYVAHGVVAGRPDAARFHSMITEMKQRADVSNPYFTVYWIGGMSRTPKGIQAQFASPSHVVLRLRDSRKSESTEDNT